MAIVIETITQSFVIHRYDELTDALHWHIYSDSYGDSERGRARHKEVEQAIIDRHYLPGSGYTSIVVTDFIAEKSLRHLGIQIAFRGIATREVVKMALDECAPVRLEDRPWYVRPRRDLFSFARHTKTRAA